MILMENELLRNFTSFRVKNILLLAKIYFTDKVLLRVTQQLVTLILIHYE